MFLCAFVLLLCLLSHSADAFRLGQVVERTNSTVKRNVDVVSTEIKPDPVDCDEKKEEVKTDLEGPTFTPAIEVRIPEMTQEIRDIIEGKDVIPSLAEKKSEDNPTTKVNGESVSLAKLHKGKE